MVFYIRNPAFAPHAMLKGTETFNVFSLCLQTGVQLSGAVYKSTRRYTTFLHGSHIYFKYNLVE